MNREIDWPTMLYKDVLAVDRESTCYAAMFILIPDRQSDHIATEYNVRPEMYLERFVMKHL